MFQSESRMPADEALALVAQLPHWHQAFEIIPGVWTPGAYNPGFLLDMLQLPAVMTGERVLDIGTSDGYFALEMSRRGATVVCVDYRDRNSHGFGIMERITGRELEYHRANIYDLTATEYGTFDRVLCLGVLYHLPDMVRALHVLRGLTNGLLYLETHSDNQFCPDVPAARYYARDTLGSDWSNFWSPNRLCVLDMLADVGFESLRDEIWSERLFVAARATSTEASRRKIPPAYGLLGRK